MRIRFSIRLALFAISLLALFFAWVGYHIQCGRSERDSVNELSRAGIFALQSDYSDAVSVKSVFSFNIGTRSWPGDEMSVLGTLPPQARRLSQRIFGDDFHVRYVALIIYERPSLEIAEIEASIQRLPNLAIILSLIHI